MKIIHKQLDLDPRMIRSISKHLDLKDFFLIDIETTGFSSIKEQIYLMGCIYYEENGFYFIQWLCEKTEDEYELLLRFAKFIQNFHYVLHYNGTQFDMPFIKRRLQLFQIPSFIDALQQIDVYTLVRPYQKYLKLENLKLKSIEKLYGYERNDHYTGGMLIQTYKDYLNTHANALELDLLLHNEEDLLGLYQSLQAGEIVTFLKELPSFDFSSTAVHAQLQDLNLQLKLPIQTPLDLEMKVEPYLLLFTKTSISINILLVEDTLSYYYQDFKDYYFLPAENKVIHKSLAGFVEREHRMRATRENCHIKKRGIFIPLPKNFTTTLRPFKYHYKDSTTYVELTDSLFQENVFFQSFVASILKNL